MTIDSWIGPLAEEHRMHAARRDNDLAAYFAVLATVDVFVPCRLDDAEENVAGTRTAGARYATFQRNGETCLEVYTRGLIPAVRPEGVYSD